MTDRRTGAVGPNVDLKRTPTLNRQTGAVGAGVDLARTLPPVQRRTGSIGVMVDGVLSAVATMTWNASAFQIGGAFPAANWLTNHFVSTGGAAVTWDSTNRRFALA